MKRRRRDGDGQGIWGVWLPRPYQDDDDLERTYSAWQRLLMPRRRLTRKRRRQRHKKTGN